MPMHRRGLDGPRPGAPAGLHRAGTGWARRVWEMSPPVSRRLPTRIATRAAPRARWASVVRRAGLGARIRIDKSIVSNCGLLCRCANGGCTGPARARPPGCTGGQRVATSGMAFLENVATRQPFVRSKTGGPSREHRSRAARRAARVPPVPPGASRYLPLPPGSAPLGLFSARSHLVSVRERSLSRKTKGHGALAPGEVHLWGIAKSPGGQSELGRFMLCACFVCLV